MSEVAKVRLPETGLQKTVEAIERQISAMGSAFFEVGLLQLDASNGELRMIPRVWEAKTLIASAGWLRYQNREGRNIYVRPRGEHDLTLIDDLTQEGITLIKKTGFNPAVIVETSPGNYQAWLKHPQQLDKNLGTAAARVLAERFNGDPGAADWRHFGRVAGFTNRKPKYLDPVTGLYPFVHLIEASGEIYPEAERFLVQLKKDLERKQREKELLSRRFVQSIPARPFGSKDINAFRTDPRYGGDGTRIDLAYAIYALARGSAVSEVQTTIRSRDLSHKGNERRQNEYVERTIKKALETLERGR